MATPFQTEAWTEYGVGVLIVLLRIFARWKAVGFQWQGDDWFTIGVLIFWTSELVMLELIGQFGTNIGITNDIGKRLSEADLKRLEFGSKCLLAGWTFYVSLIWCLKACMLFLYNRLTLGLRQQKAVKITAVISVAAYIATIAVIYGHCTPLPKLWQVYPYPGDNCSLSIPNYEALVVTNIFTDILILSIPLPILWKVNLPLRRKFVISLLLCSGIFIMVATILRCVLSLRDINGINTSTIWAIRETFVGIIAVNAPCIKPLISKARWLVSTNRSSDNKDSHGYYNKRSSFHPLSDLGGPMAKNKQNDLAGNSSEEEIIRDPQRGFQQSTVVGGRATSAFGIGEQLGKNIRVTTTYEVEPGRKLDV